MFAVVCAEVAVVLLKTCWGKIVSYKSEVLILAAIDYILAHVSDNAVVTAFAAYVTKICIPR